MAVKKFSDYNALTASALRGDETVLMADTSSTGTVTASTISATAADNSINDSGAGLPLVKVGALVSISGFTDSAGELNGFHTVVSSTASKLVVSTSIMADEAAGQSVTVAEVSTMYQITLDELGAYAAASGDYLTDSGDTIVNIRETKQNVTTGAIDVALGQIITLTPSSDVIIDLSNFDEGMSVKLKIVGGDTHAVDWSTTEGVQWFGGVPTLGATHTVILEKDGATTYGYDAQELV